MSFSRQSATHRATRASSRPRLSQLTAGAAVLALAAAGVATAADSADPSAASPTSAAASTPASASQSSHGAADPSDLATLRQELERQQQQLRELEKRIAADEAAKSSATGNSPANPNALSGSFGPDGFVLASADGLNVLRLEGNLSLDYRNFLDSDNATDDTWLVRKARPILEGTLDGMFDFRLMPDFGQGKALLQDAWADARVEPWLVFEVGKFKAPVGLERLQLEQFGRFIEASLTADLLPYRDLGFMALGDLGHGVLDYQLAMLDGAPDGGSTDANSTPDADSTGKFTYDARAFLHPFAHAGWSGLEKLGLGVAGTYVSYVGTATTSATTSLLTTYKSTGQQSFFSFRSDSATGFNNATIADGIERRIVPQFNYYYRMFGLLGEYVKADQQVVRDITTTTLRSGTLDNRATCS